MQDIILESEGIPPEIANQILRIAKLRIKESLGGVEIKKEEMRVEAIFNIARTQVDEGYLSSFISSVYAQGKLRVVFSNVFDINILLSEKLWGKVLDAGMGSFGLVTFEYAQGLLEKWYDLWRGLGETLDVKLDIYIDDFIEVTIPPLQNQGGEYDEVEEIIEEMENRWYGLMREHREESLKRILLKCPLGTMEVYPDFEELVHIMMGAYRHIFFKVSLHNGLNNIFHNVEGWLLDDEATEMWTPIHIPTIECLDVKKYKLGDGAVIVIEGKVSLEGDILQNVAKKIVEEIKGCLECNRSKVWQNLSDDVLRIVLEELGVEMIDAILQKYGKQKEVVIVIRGEHRGLLRMWRYTSDSNYFEELSCGNTIEIIPLEGEELRL